MQRISYGPDPLQFGELRLPAGAGPHPVLMSIHGGFWRAQYKLDYNTPMCEALTSAGWATWNIEYRRIGDPGGGWPGTFLDVAAAADHVRQLADDHHLDLDRVVTLGHSAGGHLAIWLAGRTRIQPGDPLHSDAPIRLKAAVSLAGVLDLRRAWQLRLGGGVVEILLDGSPDKVPERYAAASPRELLPLGVEQILIHGTADQNVPFEISVVYEAAAKAHGDDVRPVSLKDVDHFEIIDPNRAAGRRVVEVVAGLR